MVGHADLVQYIPNYPQPQAQLPAASNAMGVIIILGLPTTYYDVVGKFIARNASRALERAFTKCRGYIS